MCTNYEKELDLTVNCLQQILVVLNAANQDRSNSNI